MVSKNGAVDLLTRKMNGDLLLGKNSAISVMIEIEYISLQTFLPWRR